MTRATRFKPMTDEQKQSRESRISAHAQDRAALKLLSIFRQDEQEVMSGIKYPALGEPIRFRDCVDYGGENSYPLYDAPYNFTHQPAGYFTFLRGGSSAALAANETPSIMSIR